MFYGKDLYMGSRGLPLRQVLLFDCVQVFISCHVFLLPAVTTF